MRIALPGLDVAFSAIFVLFGLWVIWLAIDFGITSETGPGSGTFPLVAGIFIAAFSLLNLMRSVHRARNPDTASMAGAAPDAGPGAELEQPSEIELAELLKIAAIIALIGIYLYAFPFLGAFLHLPLLMMGISLVIHWRTDAQWLASLFCVAMLFTVACYFIFEVFLNVLLPDGPLGF